MLAERRRAASWSGASSSGDLKTMENLFKRLPMLSSANVLLVRTYDL